MPGERFRFGEQITIGGYRCDEVSSLLQKAIRRADERMSLWAASELHLSGYGLYAFRRLRTIASEDVGLGWSEGPAVIRALYDNFVDEVKTAGKDAKPGVGMLYLAHAVLALTRAPKSRIVDNACSLYYSHRETLGEVTIPEWALDLHTAAGRAVGRTERSQYAESYGVCHQTLRDDYVGPAHPWMTPEQIELFAEPHDKAPRTDGANAG